MFVFVHTHCSGDLVAGEGVVKHEYLQCRYTYVTKGFGSWFMQHMDGFACGSYELGLTFTLRLSLLAIIPEWMIVWVDI